MEEKDIKPESTNPASEIPAETVQYKSRRGAGKSYVAAMEYFDFKTTDWKGLSSSKEEPPAFEKTKVVIGSPGDLAGVTTPLAQAISGTATTSTTTVSNGDSTIKLRGASGMFGTYQDYLDASAKIQAGFYQKLKSASIPPSPKPSPKYAMAVDTPYPEETSKPSDTITREEYTEKAREAHRRITEEPQPTRTEFSELNHPTELRIQSPYSDFINDYRRRLMIALTSAGVTAKNMALNDALEFTRYADHEFTNLLKNKVKEEPFKNLPLNEVEEVIVNVEELSRTLAGIMLGINPENEESLCEAQEEKAAELAKLIFSHKRKTDA